MQIYQNALIEKDLMLQNDGAMFYGMMKNHELFGYGLILYPDGSYYYGLFDKSIPKGYGQYKMKLGCLRVGWDDDGNINDLQNIDNEEFIDQVIDFKNNQYGQNLVIKKCNNKYCYGVQNNRKFEGFSVLHYKNGDIFYGSMAKGKYNGEGIIYNKETHSWQLKKFINGRASSVKQCGLNLVPRDIIIYLFSRIYKSKQILKNVNLSEIQRCILQKILQNEYPSTVASEFDDHQNEQKQQLEEQPSDQRDCIPSVHIEEDCEGLQVYKEEKEEEELQIRGRLSHQQTQRAISRVRQHSRCQFTPIVMTPSPIRVIYKRSSTPILTTIRPLFTVIRL